MPHPTLRIYDGYKHTSPQLKNDVKELQKLLQKKSLEIKVDGFFGTETEKAVLKFQKENNLNEDGIVGPDTWAALLDIKPPDKKTFLETVYPSDNRALKQQLKETEKYRKFIEASAARYKFQPSVICGIGSRESSWGLSLKPKGPAGTGDFIKRKFPPAYRKDAVPPDGGGFGRGLMQIDFDAHEFARTGNWKDAEENIEYGCKVLSQSHSYLKRKTNLRERELLRAAIAGYNCGAGNVLRAINAGLDVDYYTFGRDYSKDVLNRAGWFQMNGWK